MPDLLQDGGSVFLSNYIAPHLRGWWELRLFVARATEKGCIALRCRFDICEAALHTQGLFILYPTHKGTRALEIFWQKGIIYDFHA